MAYPRYCNQSIPTIKLVPPFGISLLRVSVSTSAFLFVGISTIFRILKVLYKFHLIFFFLQNSIHDSWLAILSNCTTLVLWHVFTWLKFQPASHYHTSIHNVHHWIGEWFQRIGNSTAVGIKYQTKILHSWRPCVLLISNWNKSRTIWLQPT